MTESRNSNCHLTRKPFLAFSVWKVWPLFNLVESRKFVKLLNLDLRNAIWREKYFFWRFLTLIYFIAARFGRLLGGEVKWTWNEWLYHSLPDTFRTFAITRRYCNGVGLSFFCLFLAPTISTNKTRMNIRARDIVPEIIDSGPICITGLFQNKSVAYFNPKYNTFQKCPGLNIHFIDSCIQWSVRSEPFKKVKWSKSGVESTFSWVSLYFITERKKWGSMKLRVSV